MKLKPFYAAPTKEKKQLTVDKGFMSNLGAAYKYQYAPIVGAANEYFKFSDVEADPDFDPIDHIEDKYINYAEHFFRAKNMDHFNEIKARLDSTLETRAQLDRLSWYNPALLTQAVLDPINIVATPMGGRAIALARGGLAVSQAFKESAKIGFKATAAAETVRAPFDPVATKEEVAATLAAGTFLSGAIGSIPSAIRNSKPAFNSVTDRFNAYRSGRADLELDGELDAFTVQATADVDMAPAVQRTDKSISYNDEAIYDDFYAGKDAVVNDGRITNPDDYKQFLIHREILSDDIKRLPGQTEAGYKQAIDTLALNRVAEGYGLKQTSATKSRWFNFVSTPSKRIQQSDKSPDIVKQDIVKINGSGAMALERNTAGIGNQSIYQRSPRHTLRADKLETQLKELWSLEVFNGHNRDFLAIPWRKLEGWWKGKKDFDTWLNEKTDLFIEHESNPMFAGQISQSDEQVFTFFRKFFDDFLVEAQDVGYLKDVGNIDARLAQLSDRLTDFEAKQNNLGRKVVKEGKEEVVYTKKQKAEFDRLEEQIKKTEIDIEYHKGLKDLGEDRPNFKYPINYNTKLLADDPAMEQRLVEVFEEHIRKNPRYTFWDENAGKWQKIDPSQHDPAKIARQAVNNIMGKSDGFEPSGVSRGKHLLHRTINIPEHKVKDFIYKGSDVLYVYADRMGKKIEWRRQFGGRTIEQVLDDHEILSRSQGKMTEKEIAQQRADFFGEYERVMGIHVREPDKLSRQAVKALKETAGLTYLHQAGLSAVADGGMLIFERGFAKTMAPLMDQKSVKTMIKVAQKDLQFLIEGTNLAQNYAKRRMMEGNMRRVEPNAVEKVFNPITNAFYNIPVLGNNLGMITKYFKIYDGVLRQTDLIQKSIRVKKNSARAADVEYLARYGIDESSAKRIADLTENNKEGELFFADLDNWPRDTALERELIRKWETAMNSGAGNTILHSTSFDRPLMMDGVLYVRHHPYMEKLTLGALKPDPIASTANIKLARLESGVMTLPFQFLDFTLGATTRITSQMFDPSRQHRLSGSVALMGLAYMSLRLKKDDWWFEDKTYPEIFARTFDHSGIMGIYGDIMYETLSFMALNGMADPENMIVPPRYVPKSNWEAGVGLVGGPAGGQLQAWFEGVQQFMDGDSSEAAKTFSYNLPLIQLLMLDDDMRELTETSRGDLYRGR